MLRRLETMILMTGYEMPLWAIREQIASAVDLIVHTARLKDGSRKIVNITEVFGIEDEEILTQDIFAFEQTGIRDGKVEGELKPTGFRPTFMGQFKRNGVRLPPGEFGIPSAEDARPMPRRKLKERWGGSTAAQGPDASGISVGHGRAVAAGGMIYVSAIGPVDRATGLTVPGGIKDQAKSCLTNLKAVLEEQGSSLEKVVWANWSLYDRTEFDTFYEEWLSWFPDIAPVGQGTLMPPPERRAGFRVSIGVIAEAG
jgi:enamine deaminase RidA (YjgF/YER057c/UK114 family)